LGGTGVLSWLSAGLGCPGFIQDGVEFRRLVDVTDVMLLLSSSASSSSSFACCFIHDGVCFFADHTFVLGTGAGGFSTGSSSPWTFFIHCGVCLFTDQVLVVGTGGVVGSSFRSSSSLCFGLTQDGAGEECRRGDVTVRSCSELSVMEGNCLFAIGFGIAGGEAKDLGLGAGDAVTFASETLAVGKALLLGFINDEPEVLTGDAGTWC